MNTSRGHFITLRVVLTTLILIIYSSCIKNSEKVNADLATAKDSVEQGVNNSHKIPVSDNDSLVQNIKKTITTKYIESNDLKLLDSVDRKFSFQEVDLNNDGKKEVFVNFFTPYFCGTGGCSLLLLDSDLNIITRFTVTETPIYISPETRNGWNVLMVKSKDDWKTLEFRNGKYPSNPSMAKDSSAEPDPKSILVFKDPNDSKVYNF